MLLQSSSDERASSRDNLIGALALLAFTLLLFAPLMLGYTYSMVGQHMRAQYPWNVYAKTVDTNLRAAGYPQTDNAETFYPLSVWATNTLRGGELPLWMSTTFAGYPIVELGMTSFFYPPRFAAMLLLDPPRQHDVLLFIHLLIAGLGMFALLRACGVGVAGAILGGMIWEANGHNAFYLTFEHIALSAAWLPIEILCAELAIRRRSFMWAVGCGISVGMNLLTGSIHMVYLGGLVLAAWYGWRVIALLPATRTTQRTERIRFLALPAVSLAIALLVGAAQWMPMVGSLDSVYRKPLSAEAQHAQGIGVVALARSLFFPKHGAFGVEGTDFSILMFTGVAALVAAVIAATLLWRTGIVRFALAVALISATLSLGFLPVLHFLRLLPLFGTIHPFNLAFPYCFAIALLAGIGLNAFLPEGPSRRAHVAAAAFISVEAIQLFMYFILVNPLQPERRDYLYPQTPFIAAARRLQGAYHVMPVNERPPVGHWKPVVLAGNVASAFGLKSVGGYESLLNVYTAGFWRTVEDGGSLARSVPNAYRPYFYNDNLPFDLMEKASVRLLLTAPHVHVFDSVGRDLVASGQLKVAYDGPDGSIYSDDKAYPRAYLARRVVKVSGPREALETLADPSFDARTTAIVFGRVDPGRDLFAAPAAMSNSDRAEIVVDRQNFVEIDTSSTASSILVLNDTWDDDWSGSVDGVATPVMRVNYTFRGLRVPAGRHRVVFTYLPTRVVVGVSITMLALVGSVLAFISTERRRRASHARLRALAQSTIDNA